MEIFVVEKKPQKLVVTSYKFEDDEFIFVVLILSMSDIVMVLDSLLHMKCVSVCVCVNCGAGAFTQQMTAIVY